MGSRNRKRKNKRRKQTQEQYRPEAATPTPSKQPANAAPRPPIPKWVGVLLVATVATLLAAAVTNFTRVFEAKLRVTNRPAAVNLMGVVGGASEARHLVDVHFCVTNSGIRSGSVSNVRVNAVGLPKIPKVEVQDLDRAPISAFGKRSVSAKLLVEDAMPTPEKSRMKLDVFDDNNQSIGAFEIDVPRPWKFERRADGSVTESAMVRIAGFDACQKARTE
jgi:hypothetical protein